MLAAFWEDYYEDHKLEARKGKDGEVVFETGDQYIDKWEKELAMGITPDLLEDLPSWHRDKMQKEQDRIKKQSEKNYVGDDFDEDDGFDDNYEPEVDKSNYRNLPVLGRGR